MKFMYIIIYNAGYEGKAKGKWEFLKEKKTGRWGPTTWARADSRAGVHACSHARPTGSTQKAHQRKIWSPADLPFSEKEKTIMSEIDRRNLSWRALAHSEPHVQLLLINMMDGILLFNPTKDK